jgi:probable DNA repair protein
VKIDRIDKIIKAVEDGAAVVTVNKRLARYLSGCYETSMMDRGEGAWTSPVIMPLFSWAMDLLEDRWQKARSALITEARATALWKRIIEEDKGGTRDVLLVSGAWRAAYSAYGLMKEYRIKTLGADIYLGAEALAFKRWSREYDKALKRLGFMDKGELLEVVIRFINDGELVLPDKVIFAGFDETTPQRAAFVRALQEAGTECECWPEEACDIGADDILRDGIGAGVELRTFKSIREEIKGCARWLRELAGSRAQGARVGVIVPELDKYRDDIIREFRAELSPSAVLPWQGVEDVFNVSLGAPLAQEPLVTGALDILSVGLWPGDISRISTILLLPFIRQPEAERLVLAAIDVELKDKKLSRLGLRELRDGFVRRKNETLKDFTIVLDKWIGLLESGHRAALPGIWAQRFSAILTTVGWQSGGASLSSREFQTLESWKALLTEFAGLGDIIGAVSCASAVARLRAMASEKIFQMESVASAQGCLNGSDEKELTIEVMGLLEASGQGFDYVWLMGAHDDALPGRVAPNSFIPIELQRRFAMPRATPEQMLGFANASLRRIFESTDSFIVSYPAEVDGKEVRLTSILRGLYEARESLVSKEGFSLKEKVHKAFALEDMARDEKIPLGAAEAKVLRGGTSVIKDQSECAFRAFAKYRLGASAITLPEDGLDAAERGVIVHKVLEFFWKEVKNSERLRELKEGEGLAAVIEQAVGNALASGDYAKRLPRQLIDMEGERVTKVVAEWFEVELRRAPFSVERIECREQIDIGGLSIFVRLDRVDVVEGGAKVVIDYKTGDCAKTGWLPDNLTEPQMLLYGIGSDFDALAFAKLKLPDTRFVGISKDDGVLPGVKSLENDNQWREKIEGVNNWDDLRGRWRVALTRIAEEFVEGGNDVALKKHGEKGNDVCRYCELGLFCRIFEADANARDVREDAGG